MTTRRQARHKTREQQVRNDIRKGRAVGQEYNRLAKLRAVKLETSNEHPEDTAARAKVNKLTNWQRTKWAATGYKRASLDACLAMVHP